MATPTLEECFAELEAMQKSDFATFDAMARNAADGRVPDPSELQRVLLSTKKDLAEFRALVGTFSRRAELRQAINFAQDAEKQIPALRADIERHNEELERHVAAHEEACRPIQTQIRSLTDAINEKADARRELFNSCPSSELRSKYEAAISDIHAASKAIENEKRNHRQIETDASHHPETNYESRLKSIRQRITELEERRTQLHADRDLIEEAMRSY